MASGRDYLKVGKPKNYQLKIYINFIRNGSHV